MLFRSRCVSLWQQARVLDDALGLDPILLEELREFLGRIEHGLEPARVRFFSRNTSAPAICRTSAAILAMTAGGVPIGA